jgi:hypothetical protein
MAVLGIFAAYLWTMQWPSFDWSWRKSCPGVERVLDSDFGVKPFVAALTLLIERIARGVGDLWDKKTLDSWIERTANWTEDAAKAVSFFASGRLNDYLWWILFGSGLMLLRFLR